MKVKSMSFVISDILIYQNKENYPEYPELKKSHSFIEFRYCDKKSLHEQAAALWMISLCPESLCPRP